MTMRGTLPALALGLLLLPLLAACGGPAEEADTTGAPADTIADAPAEAAKPPTEAPAVPAIVPEFPTYGDDLATTDSGLSYEDLVVGDGAEAVAGGAVQVNYSGFLEDGTLFDSSYNPNREPFEFVLGQGDVIPGWDEGVAGMKEGGRRVLVIPASLGYGATGVPGVIPAGATLIFDVELLRTAQ